MKYPLDKICVRSGVFCPSCQRKLDSGLVDHSEVDVMKALMELEDRLKELRKGEYVKSYTIDDVVVIILRNGWERRELETIARETAYKLRKKVKIALDTGDRKRLVEQVVSPARITGINTLWLPDGSEQMVIRIARRDQKFLGDKKKWETLLTKILGTGTRISFE